MSAELEPVAWNVYCADCNEGSGPHGDYDDADSWAAEHDAENHQERAA
jgi:hypothetical protein